VLAGVRARQENVVFVTCEDEDLISSTVRPLLGKQVSLDVTGGSVTLSLDDATPSNGSGKLSGDAAAPTAVTPSSIEPAR
jgi:phosphoglucan,water dikinase